MQDREPSARKPRMRARTALGVVTLAALSIAALGLSLSAQGMPRATQTPAPTPGLALKSGPPIQSQALAPAQWQAPPPDSVLVVDSAEPGPRSQILLVTPSSGLVTSVAQLDSNPMIVVSKLRDLVVMTSTIWDPTLRLGVDTVRVLSMVSGRTVMETKVKHRAMAVDPVRTIALSPSGRYLYVPTLEIIEPGVDRWGLTTIDLESGRTLGSVDLGHCGPSTIATHASGLVVLCRHELHLLGAPESPQASRRIPIAQALAAAGLFQGKPDGASVVVLPTGRLAAITVGGQVLLIEPISGAVLGGRDLDLAGGVMFGQVQASADGQRLYVLAGTSQSRLAGQGSRVIALSATSLTTEAEWDAPGSTSLAGTSSDSRHLYVLKGPSRILEVVDARTGALISSVTTLGKTPWLAVTAR